MLNFLSSVLFFTSVLLTIFIAQFFPEFWFLNLSYFIFLLSLGLLLFLFIFNKKISWYKNIIILLLIVFLWIFIASVRLHFTFKEKSNNHISHFINTKSNVIIKWKICDEVDIRSNWIKYTICTQSIEKLDDNVKNTPINVYWKILVTTDRYPVYSYWETLLIRWKLLLPKEDKDFSYKNYLSRYEIYWLVQNATVEKFIISDIENNFIKWYDLNVFDKLFFYLFYLKSNFLETISKIYPEPHWSLLSGILVWSRKWLPDDIMNDFRINWLAHIIAISWYNVTLVIVVISRLLWFLPRKLSFFVLSISIILFTIFVWWSSAVVRASIMWILWLIALNVWRPNVILNATLFTAFLMSIFNPKILWWDIWFQLSFLSLIWVIWLSPMFLKFIEKIPNVLWFRESIVLTVSASIMTSQLMAYHFWFFSIISPITNIFVAPLIPLIMFFWFLSSILSINLIQQSLGFLTYCFLDLLLYISHFFAEFKYSFIQFQPWWKLVVLFYIIIFIFILFYYIMLNRNTKI